MAGKSAGEGVRKYTDNRLTQIMKGADAINNTYDVTNRLITKSGPDGLIRYVYDGWNVIAEVGNSGNIKKKYIHGPRVDEILSQKKGNQTLYLTRDGLGSTRELTKENGNVQQRFDYDAFGAVTVMDKNGAVIPDAPKTNYLFTGRELQPETGLYNYRNRFYHPGVGRFLQMDPILEKGGINIYAYVKNNPVLLSDALGLIDWVGEEALAAKADLEQTEVGRDMIKCLEGAEKSTGMTVTVMKGIANRYYWKEEGGYGKYTITMSGKPTTYVSDYLPKGMFAVTTPGQSLAHEIQHATDHLKLGEKKLQELRSTPAGRMQDQLEKRAVEAQNKVVTALGGPLKGFYPRTEY